MDHRTVAALNQDVGHGFAQRSALRNGEQVALAFGVGAGDERGIFKPLRLFKYRVRDVDVVVEGEHMDHIGRRVRDRRQPMRQLGARLGLDRADEAHHDVIKDADLLIGIA